MSQGAARAGIYPRRAWTPFLQLRGNSLIGNTLAGSEHRRRRRGSAEPAAKIAAVIGGLMARLEPFLAGATRV
jgi:hypothetical protein